LKTKMKEQTRMAAIIEGNVSAQDVCKMDRLFTKKWFEHKNQVRVVTKLTGKD